MTQENHEKTILVEIKKDFEKNSNILSEQMKVLFNAVAPYMEISDISQFVNDKSVDKVKNTSFFQLNSCTIEEQDDLFQNLNRKMEKLLMTVFPLTTSVFYGVVSRKGRTNLVFGVDYEKKEIVKSIMEGILTGIDIEEKQGCEFNWDSSTDNDNNDNFGGFISAVPVIEEEKERQQFDISTLMKSLNGKDYSVIVYAEPKDNIPELYTSILKARDRCYAVSKCNLSMQKSLNDRSITDTMTTNTRGVIQELANQLIREHKLEFNRLIDSFIDAGIQSVSKASTIAEISKSKSIEIQNSTALEIINYCDKAIERLKHGMSSGLWNAVITYSASDETDAKILKSCLYGELGRPTTDIIPLAHFDYPETKSMILFPNNTLNNPLFVPVTSKELGMLCTPPVTSVPDFEVRSGKLYPLIASKDSKVTIGKISDGQRAFENMPFSLSEKDLNKHTFICGITGSGKTTTVKTILLNAKKPFIVIESAKKEYRNMGEIDDVFTLGKPEINCIQMNPFYVQCGINLQTHIDFLKDLFNASFSFYGPMPYILEKCLNNIYRKRGWNLTFGYHPYIVNLTKPTDIFEAAHMQKQYALKACDYLFPTMYDLKEEVKRYIENEMQYDGEVAGNIKSAILSRLESLCLGSKGFMFNTYNHADWEEIMKRKVVFELEGLADDSDKAFCVGLFLIFINEYRQVAKELDNKEGLKHLLVIEEAHRLLKNVDTEKSSEGLGNPKGKAVEHFTNMIAEMRTYGQGVIIAEQIPSKLTPDVIKNSSNKIVQRIVSADDQALIANTIGIKTNDAVYLGNLKTGFALCHKEGMNLPVLVQISGKSDSQISDSDIRKKDITEIFDVINEQLIIESMGKVLNEFSLKLLNTLMVMDEQTVSNDIRKCREKLDERIKRNTLSLLPMTSVRKEGLYGKILTERVLIYLNSKMYRFGSLAPDDLQKAIEKLFITAISEEVKPVKEQLTALYKRDCRSVCCDIISEIVRKNGSPSSIDVEQEIKLYFFTISDGIVNKIYNKVRG